MLATLRDLKAFFEWLSREPGFLSRNAAFDALTGARVNALANFQLGDVHLAGKET